MQRWGDEYYGDVSFLKGLADQIEIEVKY